MINIFREMDPKTIEIKFNSYIQIKDGKEYYVTKIGDRIYIMPKDKCSTR